MRLYQNYYIQLNIINYLVPYLVFQSVFHVLNGLCYLILENLLHIEYVITKMVLPVLKVFLFPDIIDIVFNSSAKDVYIKIDSEVVKPPSGIQIPL